MKKLVLSLLAVSAIAFTTQAQTEKGNFVVGGTVQYQSEKVDGANKADKTFQIVPSVGYFVANNIAVGTGIGYQYAKDYTTVASVQTSAFVVSPFARAYKGVSDQFKFFGQLSVPMSFGNNKVGDVNGDNMTKTGKNNTIGIALSPGFAFFPTKSFGIEFAVQGISYNDNKLENANGDKISGSKDFNIGADFFAPKIGVQFYF
ncbi:porin family protein [Pedobacter sp. MC2016-14]|uniref:outer membrane beta-barrel protein n=1 Tax=Pedobacter sp. MC2016-14 TaxID=2897327 RepID=UPI001E293425|nr:outer membrane beta-barrel protein [Pedobacter sp. MC2016-14]MCD0489431.1 porin family protein [Pedobacter sp. MC2016-14]